MRLVCAILALTALGGCANPNVAGIVNGKEIITSAPVHIERPYLRDNVRREDIMCGSEPFAKRLTSQKEINQNVKNKVSWGRECKRKNTIAWTVISQEK